MSLVKPDTVSVFNSIAHDSALHHVNGSAIYIDDLPEIENTLHAAVGVSPYAHAEIKSIDLSDVLSYPGVDTVLTAKDVPGINDIGPAFPGDPIFAEKQVDYAGQSIFAVLAKNRDIARKAAQLAKISFNEKQPILTIEEAQKKKSYVLPPKELQRGDIEKGFKQSDFQLEGKVTVGGQDHFYLESQASYAIPQEGNSILLYSSSQHPSEIQHLTAKALKLNDHDVTVQVRRMGGAFGGKETQAALFAVIAALGAKKTQRPVKICLDRDDDMVITGKRHGFDIGYKVGFDQDGHIQALDITYASNCGMSPDLSAAINDRAMLHADNCYFLDNVRIKTFPCKTHTVSNTAFRGFGGPQGMVGIENIMDDIAQFLKKDPLDVRKNNFYGLTTRNITPYGMVVEDNILEDLIDDLEKKSDYKNRKKEIDHFNEQSPYLKKGIYLTPVKFGISFTLTHLNQAGALVHIYQDGSIMLNHGGTEMGQGLYIKIAQIVSEEFKVPLDKIKITAADTSKVANTSPTAASSGSDLNGMAALKAARTIKERLIDFAASSYKVTKDQIEFTIDGVRIGNQTIKFKDLIAQAYVNRIQLWSDGFYKTPKLHFDRQKMQGRPFLYFAYGAAVSEVIIDSLTGEYTVSRVDIVHDCGQSLNPAMDIGQIEGGFIQGMGWLTMEELYWDDKGHLKTHAPSTYKIPTSRDIPDDFHVHLYSKGYNNEETIYRSKAVGEPPLMLGISTFYAIKEAIKAAIGDNDKIIEFHAPATPENVLMTIEKNKNALD